MFFPNFKVKNPYIRTTGLNIIFSFVFHLVLSCKKRSNRTPENGILWAIQKTVSDFVINGFILVFAMLTSILRGWYTKTVLSTCLKPCLLCGAKKYYIASHKSKLWEQLENQSLLQINKMVG